MSLTVRLIKFERYDHFRPE